MSNTVTFSAGCGCVFDIDVYYDCVDGVTVVDDVCIVAICNLHGLTPRAADSTKAGETRQPDTVKVESSATAGSG